MSILDEINQFTQQGRAKNVKELVAQALSEGYNARQILEEGLLAAMGIVGTKFKNNEVYIPEVLITARAMNAGVEILKPDLQADGQKAKGKVVIGTVKGDLHDIGKNLVKIMFEGRGLEVIDAGVDVSAEDFVKLAIENDAQIIACSALLTTTMTEIKGIVDATVKAGIRDKVKIMIGGAPITQAFCEQVGADIYTSDAASAAEEAIKAISK